MESSKSAYLLSLTVLLSHNCVSPAYNSDPTHREARSKAYSASRSASGLRTPITARLCIAQSGAWVGGSGKGSALEEIRPGDVVWFEPGFEGTGMAAHHDGTAISPIAIGRRRVNEVP